MKKIILILPLLIILFSCSTKSKEKETTTEESTLKSVSDLTYTDIVNTVVTGSGKQIEYHGEPTVTDALTDVTILTEGSCGANNCGKTVFIANQSAKKVKTLVRSPFQIGTWESYVALEFLLEAGQTAEIGCSHFCYNDQSYPFKYDVIGAEYVE